MSILEIGQKLVEAANAGQEAEGQFVTDYYANDVVSIEGGEDDGDMPSRLEGIDAIRGKHAWWFGNNDMHSTTAVGPFIGKRDDQFVVHYVLDVTPNGGERMQMSEVGIYTVINDKIAQEEYLYLMG
jgi:hypothetical protein